MPRGRRGNTKRCLPIWVSFLAGFALLAMVPLVMLSTSQHHNQPDVRAPHPKSFDLSSGSTASQRVHAERPKDDRKNEAPVGARAGQPSVEPVGDVVFFPSVQKLDVEDPSCCAVLAHDLHVRVSDSSMASPILSMAAERIQKKLRLLRNESLHAVLALSSLVLLIRVIHVNVVSTDESLGEGPDSEYQLSCGGHLIEECHVQANGVYGAVSALQSTLVQLFSDRGAARFHKIKVHDWPQFKVRGIMIDTGRRFVPSDILRQHVLEGMALTRMNMLHLHINDFCRFAIDLPSFPELRPTGFMAGQYDVEEIRALVTYARERGIRIVPELDIPGHANGLLPLKARGLAFCESPKDKKISPEEATKMYDDPEGKSRTVLKQLYEETMAAFSPDEPWLHIGADEASPVGSCTSTNIASLEGFVTTQIVRSTLRRTPLAWEELLFKKSPLDAFRATGDSNAIIVAWFHAKPQEVVDRGHRVIVANAARHYLDFDFKHHPIGNFWYDPLAPQRNLPRVRDCQSPNWEEHPGTFLGSYADNSGLLSLDEAKQRCTAIGSICAGVTCQKESGNAKCDTRKGEPFLQGSGVEVSWVKICPDPAIDPMREEQERVRITKALQGKVIGGLSAMWTDRYCYVYQCGAAHEWWAKQNGLLPGAALMFSRELDASFALSLGGMIWPRAGITAATLWNYDPRLNEKSLTHRAGWLASLLRRFGVASCPALCDCDELTACEEPYPVLRQGAAQEAGFLSMCFHRGNSLNRIGGVLETSTRDLNASLRLCFWRGKDCSGVTCVSAAGREIKECVLRSVGSETAEEHYELYVKRIDTDACAPHRAWTLPGTVAQY